MDARAFPPASARTDFGCAGAGLTEAECSAVARAARRLPGAWGVQRDEDDRGHASLGLVPDDAGPGEAAFAFLLWREDGPLRLACAQDEFYADLGAHADVAAAMGAVRRALEAAAAAARWVEATRPPPPCAWPTGPTRRGISGGRRGRTG